MPAVPKSRPGEMGAADKARGGAGMSAPHRLKERDEARGQLLSVSCADGCALARFEWGSVAFPEELEHHLRSMVGHESAILRLEGRYHVRAV